MSLMVEDGLVIGHHCESDGGGWALGHHCWPDDEGWACPHCEPVGEKWAWNRSSL